MTQSNELTDRTLVLLLQELAEDLARPEETADVASEDDARLVLGELLARGGADRAVLAAGLATEEAALATGRRLLVLAQDDEVAGTIAERLLADPPSDDQMFSDPVTTSFVVLGVMIALLQTRVRFRVRRSKDGTQVDFEVNKQPASDSTLRQLSASMLKILTH